MSLNRFHRNHAIVSEPLHIRFTFNKATSVTWWGRRQRISHPDSLFQIFSNFFITVSLTFHVGSGRPEKLKRLQYIPSFIHLFDFDMSVHYDHKRAKVRI